MDRGSFVIAEDAIQIGRSTLFSALLLGFTRHRDRMPFWDRDDRVSLRRHRNLAGPDKGRNFRKFTATSSRAEFQAKKKVPRVTFSEFVKWPVSFAIFSSAEIGRMHINNNIIIGALRWNSVSVLCS